MPKTKDSPLLVRDVCYNINNCTGLAKRIKENYPPFEEEKFNTQIKSKLASLSLKQRETFIQNLLQEYLPENFEKSVKILLASQLPKLPTSFSEEYFGDFITVPQSMFIVSRGAVQKYFDLSMNSLYEITKRFSCEFAIRELIVFDSEKSLNYLKVWTNDKNCHVRRLCSEGVRPFLPWAKKLSVFIKTPELVIPILDKLYSDKVRYVTRSVANCLNDISKIKKHLVIETLKRWEKENQQTQKEFNWIKNHTLRTLIKKADKDTLNYLGFETDIVLSSIDLSLHQNVIDVPDVLEFDITLSISKKTPVIIDYAIGFLKKNQKTSEKIFKWKKIVASPNTPIVLNKKHPFKIMSTRKLYTGKHYLSIQINGKRYFQKEFGLNILNKIKKTES